jgi:hypothetical protein
MLNQHGLSRIFCYGGPNSKVVNLDEKGWHECHPFVTTRLLPLGVPC